MKTRGLPGTLRSDVPGVGLRVQGGAPASATCVRSTPLRPRRCRPRRGRSRRVAMQVADPVHVLLDRDHHVAQHGRAARPGDREQVGEPGDGDAEVAARPGGPLLPQRQPVASAMSMASSAPVIASNPVAKTMASNSYSAATVRTPCFGELGQRRLCRSTRCTFGRLKVVVVAGVQAGPLGSERETARR